MENRIIGLIALLTIITAMIWRWETADEELKNILFYLLLFRNIGQNSWFAFKEKKTKH